MTAKKASSRRKTAEEKRKAARRAELRLEKKRAAEALQRKRSQAASKGWETRNKKKAAKVKKVRGATRTVKKSSKKSAPTKKKPATSRKVIDPFAEVRKITAKSIEKTAEKLRKVFWKIPVELGGPKPLPETQAIARATVMTQAQRNAFLKHPNFETLQEMAGDEDNIESFDDIDYSPFWYH